MKRRTIEPGTRARHERGGAQRPTGKSAPSSRGGLSAACGARSRSRAYSVWSGWQVLCSFNPNIRRISGFLPGRFPPGRATENSPALQRWDYRPGVLKSRQGRQNRYSPLDFLSPLRGSGLLPLQPTAHAVGYLHALLRSFHCVIKS